MEEIMSKIWKVQNFKAQEIYYNLNVSKEFTVPPYQRTIVWKDDQKSRIKISVIRIKVYIHNY